MNETHHTKTHGGRFYTRRMPMYTKLRCLNCKENISYGDRYWAKEIGKEIHIECVGSYQSVVK